MANIKKQRVGTLMTVCCLILGITSLIIYSANVAGEGYFHGIRVEPAVRYIVIGLLMAVCVIILAQISLNGPVDKIINIVSDGIRIAIPAIFIAAVLVTVSARVEGFAFIYFSNEEVLQEVQTPANLSSAHGAIANIVFLGLTAITGIVGAFFNTNKIAD